MTAQGLSRSDPGQSYALIVFQNQSPARSATCASAGFFEQVGGAGNDISAAPPASGSSLTHIGASTASS